MNFDKHYLECECQCFNHIMRFMDSDDEDGTIWVDVCLNSNLNIFQRIWVGLKYILGLETGFFDHYEVCITSKEELNKMLNWVNREDLTTKTQ